MLFCCYSHFYLRYCVYIINQTSRIMSFYSDLLASCEEITKSDDSITFHINEKINISADFTMEENTCTHELNGRYYEELVDTTRDIQVIYYELLDESGDVSDSIVLDRRDIYSAVDEYLN